MWILKSRNGDAVFYVKANSENIIGRNVGDLAFPNDKSVSRKHATIYSDGSNNVTVEDHGSKYGTYIDEGLQDQKRIESNVKIPIKHNSLIRFGLLGNEWTLVEQKFKSCVSTIKEGDLASVREQMNQLGVSISKEWCKDCTHLTMPTITLTLKVVLALVQSKSIVKPEFWTECLRCRNSNLPLPSANTYLPDINESSISQQANFHTDNTRITLFTGKTFIFMSRQQMKNYEEIISSAGGQSSYLGSGITHGQLSAPQSIVIQHAAGYKSSQESQVLQGKIDNITKYMTSKKKRIVPEVEIGLAILYISIEKYCNPSFNFASVIMQDKVVEIPEDKKVLAPETQETGSTPSLPSLPARYIDETLSSSIAKDRSSISPASSVHSSRTTSKRQASISPGNIEPLAKKSSVHDKHKTPQKQKEEDNLFCFVQDDTQPCTSKQKPENFQLTFQSAKRRRPDVSCNDDNLFNFVPDTDKKSETTGATLSFPQSRETKKSEGNLLNIGKNMKRKHDGSDTPDGKRINITNSTTTNKTVKNTTLEGLKYTCQKQFTGTVKEEADADTLQVISKLKDLDILPAVVVINNNLVVKKDTSHLEPSNDSSNSDGKKNFKKFVKVKPRTTCARVVSANMLVEYHPKTGNSIPEQFLADSSGEEEEDDNFRSFTSFSRQQKVTRGRSRRL